jgi:hypothetical protein
MSSDFDPHAAGTSRAGAAPASDPELDSASSVRAHSFEMVWTASEGGGDGAWDLPERFELARDLGDGRTGPVFVVRDAARERQSVRFELFGGSREGDAAQRAAREDALRATGRIEHARVAQCLELGRLGDGRGFVLRPHAEGETLEARLAREGSLHPAAALELTRQLLEALGAVHAAGLLHGALDASSVWLVARAPKSAANPHGIDVRLLDVGVAPHSASQGPELDLHAVGHLLERLLGDASVSPAAKSALELAASARAPGASVAALLHAVAEQLAAQPATRRGAELAAPKVAARDAAPAQPGAAPALLRYGLIASLAACGVLALLGWKLGNELHAAENEAGNERTRLADQLAGAAQELAKLAGELESARGELRTRDEQLGSAQRSAAAERESAERALSAERERAARELDETRTLLATERERLAQAQAQLRVAAESSDANVRAARGFDATLGLLEQGRGDEALQRARLLESEGLIGGRAHFLSSLAEAYSQVLRFEQRSEGDVAAVALVGAARRALERALAERAEFERESATWLPLEFSSDEPRTRPQRISAALDTLSARLAAAEGQRDELEQREWREIMAAPGTQDPARAFEHVARFERPEKLASLAQRFATELRARVVVDGQLDVARLASFRQLGAWSERIASAGASGGASLAPELAKDVQLLAHAQRWYDADASNDAPAEIARAEFAPVAAAAHAWRAQLVLQARLALPDAAFPLRRGQRALRRSVDPNGRVEWWRESLDGVVDGQWRLRRARFDEQGGTALGEGVLRLERKDDTWGLVGARAPWLDLRAHGPQVQAGAAPLAGASSLPAALTQFEAAARKLESALRTETCLIYEQGDVRRWFSATLGLVREETRTPSGVAVTELVALEP